MEKPILTASLGGLACAFLAAGIQAQDRMEVRGAPIFQERVSITDLDLRRDSDQRLMRRRVTVAADRVCQKAEGPLYSSDRVRPGHFDEGLNCADFAYRDAQPQMRAAIEQAKFGHPMAVSALKVAVRAR